MPDRKLLFVVTEDYYFCSHRLPLARAARDAGYEIVVATRVRKHGEQIEQEGFRLIPLRMQRRSRNPMREIQSIAELFAIYRRERPTVVHHIALKPILYGSIAARLARVEAVVNAFAGLGYVFTSRDRFARVARRAMQFAMRRALRLPNAIATFQNPDDRTQMIGARVVAEDETIVILGSGVDVRRFSPQPASHGGVPIVGLASRLLWPKGIAEFVETARRCRSAGIEAKFVLIGAPDVENRASVDEQTLLRWVEEGTIEWWRHRDDMPTALNKLDIFTLPTTYGEGIPKVMLEAAACAKPIVATNVRGCREVVVDGKNGFLIPPGDVDELFAAIKKLVCNQDLRLTMGRESRQRATKLFGDDRVVSATLAIYEALMRRRRPPAATR